MPVLILLGIFGAYGAADIYENSTKNQTPYTSEDLNKMMKEMTGKSKREARKILRRYRK
ncbi:MAG: hypothetical protein LUH40_00440 [Clostridiales bacterium]|nr:hypothetical protein [Clostridiales bacterium]